MFEITNILFKITNNSFEIPNILLKIQNILFDYTNISYKISNIFFKIPNISKVPKFRDFSNILLMRPNNLSVILKCIPNKLLEVSNIFYIFSITYCPLMCVCRLPVQILEVTLLKTKIFRIFNKLIFFIQIFRELQGHKYPIFNLLLSKKREKKNFLFLPEN